MECFSEAQKYTKYKPFSNFIEDAEVERDQPPSGLTGIAFSLCSRTQVSGVHHPHCFRLCTHFPHYLLLTAPFPLPIMPRGTAGMPDVSREFSGLAWHESGPPRRTQFCSLSESTHLERSAWWSFSLMNEREKSEGE